MRAKHEKIFSFMRKCFGFTKMSSVSELEVDEKDERAHCTYT